MRTDVSGVTPQGRQLIAAHYRLTAPLIARTFAGTPLVYATFPQGFDYPITWHGPANPKVPTDVPMVVVDTARGRYRYLALSEVEINWLVENAAAVEFHSWGCTAEDPSRARFARILLELDAPAHDVVPKSGGSHHEKQHCHPEPVEGRPSLSRAASLLRERLHELNLQAIPVLLGTNAIALWIPVSDAPTYPDLRLWLHAFCNEAVLRHPRNFTTEANSRAAGRVHLHITSNAPGRYSALPYSLRGDAELRMVVPITWDELSQIPDGSITAETFPARLNAVGDVFASQVAAIGAQRWPNNCHGELVEPRPSSCHGELVEPPPSNVEAIDHTKSVEPHGHVLRAALEILQDGIPRDAKQILQEAIARELLPPTTLAKYVYTSLIEYIVRTSGHGHKPAIVQDHDRRFRINQTPDEWPATQPSAIVPPSPDTQALIDRLEQTQHGSDPAAFELAVCDAFAHLGFASTHIGGHQNPDGYADAQLGVLGYRVMLECKTAGGNDVLNPDAVEASKYREPYHAQYCVIIGPDYTEDIEFAGELQAHGVSAWTTADLQRLLAVECNSYEMMPLFAPGFAADAVGTLLWNRVHGESKRVQLVCAYLHEAGWAAQVAAAKQGPPANAPRLNVDAAMLLVDQRLADQHSSASCTREKVQAAFEYLTSPRVAIAVWTDSQTREAIVIVEPAQSTASS